ncbi:MAG TPA: proline--tRNA ligase, partial [Chloroflexota bacterium]
MRRTQLFCETLRQDPSGSEVAGHLLLLRGMFIQPLASGLYSFLPLGARVKSKVERILREEMEAIGGQEVLLPLVQPADLWRETGRYERVGAELTRFRDRAERDMVLAMTHEEVATDLLRRHVRTYRQLPVVLFQMQTKFRDEPRARGGLIRAREFVMKDAYSGHATSEELDTFYERIYGVYLRIFRRVGLDVLPVESDVGMMGGSMAHEFMYLSPIGEDQIAICDECGYAANAQIATFVKEGSDEELQPLEEVATPDASTISALSTLLQIPASRTAKAAFFVADGRLIFAVVRGDMEVNETKLLNVANASELRPARADDLAGTGIVAGYASPVGVSGATVVVDDLVATSPNLVAGANRPGVHLRNTNLGRDYEAEVVADIAAVYDGAQCPRCSGPLHLQRGIEVGNTFKLGVTYSNALGASY